MSHIIKKVKAEVVPDVLYHGTASVFLLGIWMRGLINKKSNFVFLTEDRISARRFGQRHGNPIVMTIDCTRMFRDGFDFYKDENGIWMTEYVPPEYISIKTEYDINE